LEYFTLLDQTTAEFTNKKKKLQGWDSQNFLHKFVRFFLPLGLKILRLLRLKVLFEADIIRG